MAEQDENTVRISLRHMFGLTTWIALTLGVSSYTGSVAIGIHLTMCLVGWVLWRILHTEPGAVIPILLGGDLLLWVAYERAVCGSEDDFLGYRMILSAVASLLVLAGVTILVRTARAKQRSWKRQAAIVATAIPVLVFLWVAIIAVGSASIDRRQASDATANRLAMAKAIAMVEEVRKQTGTPPDEDTLAGQLQQPLPSVRWDGRFQQIRYTRTGDMSYELSYYDMAGFLGDTIVYNSAKGWYRIPF